MSDKTATDRLRELLDERGVEWKAHGYENHTWWSNNENVGWHAENRPSIRGLYVKVEAVLTPKQAIAATMGAGTCKLTPYEDTGITVCSECGAVQPDDWTVYYCWSCGRKVVGE